MWTKFRALESWGNPYSAGRGPEVGTVAGVARHRFAVVAIFPSTFFSGGAAVAAAVGAAKCNL